MRLSQKIRLTAMVFACCHWPAFAHETNTITAGYIEIIRLANGSVPFSAKLDSGANSSSINAPDPEVFHREGQYWVRFSLQNRGGQTQIIEAPLKSTVRIRRANTKTTRRFLIDLQTCIGGYRSVSQFSLADRRGQSYQVLVGRRLLSDRILIDTSSKNQLGQSCSSDK